MGVRGRVSCGLFCFVLFCFGVLVFRESFEKEKKTHSLSLSLSLFLFLFLFLSLPPYLSLSLSLSLSRARAHSFRLNPIKQQQQQNSTDASAVYSAAAFGLSASKFGKGPVLGSVWGSPEADAWAKLSAIGTILFSLSL